MRRARLTGRGRSFVAAGVALAVAGIILGYHDLTRVGVLLLTLIALVYLSGMRRQATLQSSRDVFPSTVPNGAPAAVRLQLTNDSRGRSRMILAEEQVSYALGDRPRFAVPGLDKGAGRALEYTVRSDRRGRHQIGPVAYRQADPFGLTSSEGVVPGAGEVIVLPRVVDLRHAEPPGAGAGTEGETPQTIALHGEVDVSIRAYRDGDDLRKVHWPATAHRGELMVRQEDRPARRSCVLVLDPAFPSDTAGQDAFEWAVSAVASIAVRMEQLGYVLRLATAETVIEEDVSRDLTAAEAVAILAGVATSSCEDAQRVFAAAHEQLLVGGIVIAVLGTRDTVGDDLVGLRQPGAAGMAMVLDVDTFRGGAEHQTSSATSAILATAGWRTATVEPSMSVAQVWSQLSQRDLVRVGQL